MYLGPRAIYFYGDPRALNRQVMVAHLIHAERQSAGPWGIAPPNQAEHLWQNFTAFKAKFGGEEVHLVPTLDLVLDPTAYDRYMAIENCCE